MIVPELDAEGLYIPRNLACLYDLHNFIIDLTVKVSISDQEHNSLGSTIFYVLLNLDMSVKPPVMSHLLPLWPLYAQQEWWRSFLMWKDHLSRILFTSDDWLITIMIVSEDLSLFMHFKFRGGISYSLHSWSFQGWYAEISSMDLVGV